MVDMVKETLANGEEYQFDLDLCNEKADELLSVLYEYEGNLKNFDYTAAVFGLFVASIHILKHSGWTTKDLVNEVLDHSEMADDEGDE
jgi:hypothetical protein